MERARSGLSGGRMGVGLFLLEAVSITGVGEGSSITASSSLFVESRNKSTPRTFGFRGGLCLWWKNTVRVLPVEEKGAKALTATVTPAIVIASKRI